MKNEDKKPENPSAFPCTGNPDWTHQEGMDLIDYFAGQALPGIIQHYCGTESERVTIAKHAYEIAEEIMKIRAIKKATK